MPPGASRRRVIFPGRQVAAAADLSAAQRKSNMFISHLPSWLKDQPLIEEELDTESSDLQLETAEECLPFLKRTFPPSLEKTKHVRFLEGSLGRLPAGFAALDASRPWMLYWALSALGALGEDLTEWREKYGER
jgi:protein farnesyltransferase subunit beta